ncbi:hypothetical protein CLIB1423_11S02410 [[Candida] railenensis]|uniref:Uncharacterized protein n=1 Tax=[Candida] railenensis TaxID=45579 RepID=A0A9P0QSG0_9ASCO|nr:hypothetical protein CLIB1423_11S02410 [[Candida] railenensis]
MILNSFPSFPRNVENLFMSLIASVVANTVRGRLTSRRYFLFYALHLLYSLHCYCRINFLFIYFLLFFCAFPHSRSLLNISTHKHSQSESPPLNSRPYTSTGSPTKDLIDSYCIIFLITVFVPVDQFFSQDLPISARYFS